MAERAPRKRYRMWRAAAAVAAGALCLALLAPVGPGRASDAPVSFLVDDLTFNAADASPGDGACRTASGTCTLRAALDETNKLAATGNPGPFTIAMKPGISGSIVVKGTANADRMYTASSLTPNGDSGAYYWVTAPGVTIDFGGRVSITPYNDAAYGTAIYADAPGLTIQNFTNLVSAETSIVASARAAGLLIRNGTFDNSYEAERALWPLNGASDITLRDIHVGELYGDAAIELPSGATVTNLWLDRVVMDNGAQGGYDHHYGIYGNGSNKLVGLTITGSTFANFKSGWHALSFAGVTLDGARIEGNRFMTNSTGSQPVIYIVPLPTGKPSVIRGNFFDNAAGGNSARAIYLSMGTAAGVKNPLSITDNYFAGFASYQSIYLNNVGTLSVERNRFGPPTYGAATSASEAGSNTMMYNTSTNANGYIATWYPAAVSYLPSQCAIDVTVQAPTTYVPAVPVTLDAYFTATDDAEVYLGRVEDVSASPATIRFPYPLGPGNVRLQTKDAQGRSSQYSRVIAVTAQDACGPAVSIEQAPWQADPANRRDMQFIAAFSEPVAAPPASAFSLDGSSAPGARVTDVTKLDDLTYLVTVRADGSGDAVLSMSAGRVRDAAGNENTASHSADNTVTFTSPLALSPVMGTLTTDTCATYQITEVPLAPGGYPVPAGPISVALSASPDEMARLSPSPAIIEPGEQSVTVTACAADGATIADGTLAIGHRVTSSDPAFDGLLLADASIPVKDATPHWRMALSSQAPPGATVRPGEAIAYTLTLTHGAGAAATVAPLIDLSAALDDASWQAGSLTITNDGTPVPGTASLAPGENGRLVIPGFTLAPGTTAEVRFRLRAEDPAVRDGDKHITVTAGPGGSEPAPGPCDPVGPGGASCWQTSHPIAAVSILKTGPATLAGGKIADRGAPAPASSPATVRPGDVTWAYTVTNTGAVPLSSLAVADDQGVPVTCPATTLAPGADMVCQGTGGIG